MIAVDCFTKWLEVYAILTEASVVADFLVTNFCFTVPRELHNDQGQNFES
jgi:hypothetical protein